MPVRLISLRQPRPHDLIGRAFVVAGIAAGFEATVMWRLVDGEEVLGQGLVQGVGSMDLMDDFGHHLRLPAGTRGRGRSVTLQVFGDDPTGERPPGTDLNEVPLRLFMALQGFRLHEVRRGDTLTAVAARWNDATADDIFRANRDQLDDPDVIAPGQLLRVPAFELT